MFYTEKLPNNNKSSLKVKLSDFSKGINTRVSENILPLNYAVNTFNYSYSSGALKEGLGLKVLEMPDLLGESRQISAPTGVTKIINAWPFKRYDNAGQRFSPYLMIYCDDKKLYYWRVATFEDLYQDTGLTFDTEPAGVNYRLNGTDSFLCCAPNVIGVYSTATCKLYSENVPSITSVALHAGRLFATTGGDQSQLWFSDDLNPTSWNVSAFDGGYIELTDERGALKKVVESNNYLYIIREFGITRVSGWGLQSDFNVKNMYLSTGKIYHNTAVLCGKIIVMMCRDGLYYFDGNDMTKLQLGLDKYFENVDNSNAVGAFLNGKYYVACKFNYNDNRTIGCEKTNFINNTLLEFDINTGELNILRGVDISRLTAFQVGDYSKLIVCSNGEKSNILSEITHDGKVYGVATQKIWDSPYTDMGYPTYKKVLKTMYIDTKNDIILEINANGKIHTFIGKGSDSTIRIPINIITNKFSITIKATTEACEISNPVLEVALC